MKKSCREDRNIKFTNVRRVLFSPSTSKEEKVRSKTEKGKENEKKKKKTKIITHKTKHRLERPMRWKWRKEEKIKK